MKTKNKIMIPAQYTFTEAYLPPRCRKLRHREVSEEIQIGIRSVTKADAPVAFVYSLCREETGNKDEIRLYNGKLYQRRGGYNDHVWTWDKLEQLKSICWFRNQSWRHYDSREDAIKQLHKDGMRYLVVDGEVWERCGEPRYVTMTFGLGHNHGGTALMIDLMYNENIPASNYFNALQFKEAQKHAIEIATRRGDTESIDTIRDPFWRIDVLIPEAVRCAPKKEASKGCSFLNELEAITEIAPDATSAGLLVIAHALKSI